MSSSEALEAEQKAFEAEVEVVKQWWSSPRWRYTKRPFTAEQIVSKRGNLPIFYPSNDQSKKLWGILETKFNSKEPSYTYGCLDPVMVTQMAKYLETVYVSGWQCSSTASSTNEPSPDLADYPMVSCIIFVVVVEFDFYMPFGVECGVWCSWACDSRAVGHRSEQSRPPLQSATVSRQETTRSTPVCSGIGACQSAERRLPSSYHR